MLVIIFRFLALDAKLYACLDNIIAFGRVGQDEAAVWCANMFVQGERGWERERERARGGRRSEKLCPHA